MEKNFIRNIFYYKRYYLDFFESLRPEVKAKFNWTLGLIATLERVPAKFFKHMMKKKVNKNLTSFADHLDQQYGKKGTPKRDAYEQEFEAFKLGVLIQEMRERQNLTQEQLAAKCGTTKSYIEYSQSFDRGELTEKETLDLSNILFDKDEPLDAKKKALGLLAHLGTTVAFRQIEKYNENPDKDLKRWTLLALQECKMFLENSLLDQNTGFISI